jgi:hypothetical protein
MSKKGTEKKKGLIILSRERVEQAMKEYEQEMKKDPGGARILKEEKEELERVMKGEE